MKSKLEQEIAAELQQLQQTFEAQVADPALRLAFAQMTADLALLPVRMARGEDVTELVAALKAEALNRALEQRVRAEAAAQQVWINVITRVLVGAISGA